MTCYFLKFSSPYSVRSPAYTSPLHHHVYLTTTPPPIPHNYTTTYTRPLQDHLYLTTTHHYLPAAILRHYSHHSFKTLPFHHPHKTVIGATQHHYNIPLHTSEHTTTAFCHTSKHHCSSRLHQHTPLPKVTQQQYSITPTISSTVLHHCNIPAHQQIVVQYSTTAVLQNTMQKSTIEALHHSRTAIARSRTFPRDRALLYQLSCGPQHKLVADASAAFLSNKKKTVGGGLIQ